MQDKPTSIDLLDAIQDFLMKEVMPTVKEKDLLSFKTLVSWNMLGVIIREIKLEEPMLEKEFNSLMSLLGKEAELLFSQNKIEIENNLDQNQKFDNTKSYYSIFVKLNLNEKKEIILKANEMLAQIIRDKKILPSQEEYFDHIMATLKDKLAISNPRYAV